MLRFIKTTVAGGLLFLLPLMLIVVLLEKAVHLLRPAVAKLLPMFPDHLVAGVTLFTLVTLLALLVVCFGAGLLAKTVLAKRLLGTLENYVLANLPGYQLAKDTATRMAGIEDAEGTSVGLYEEDGCYQFCLAMEPPSNGWMTIYLADAGPSGGTAGSLLMIPAERFQRTELSWLQVMNSMRRGGRGAVVLAEPWLPKTS
ncbi:hypothetical protein NVV93_03200 [Pseudomonas sp. LS44]|uniref:hypothetical protein n=1 Tax=Pseudomonas sp. LS44 TaxID=1357074 RepID=UPI00215B03CE|nr:hypothetical protein [Pseudomonas sp. LS44]UVE18426.1 hypothetical protein NVV93_03200 [Pseudomonas sp. LS44]